MKIMLKPNARLVKHRPYQLNPRVKDKVNREMVAGLIFLVDEVEWVSLILIYNKKDSKYVLVCVDYKILNNVCIHDSFPTPFNDKVLDNVTSNETYSFTDGFSGYHQVHIVEEDKNNTIFTTKWGSYAYDVMPFGLNNALMVFSRIVIVAFRDYIHIFLEVYMDD